MRKRRLLALLSILCCFPACTEIAPVPETPARQTPIAPELREGHQVLLRFEGIADPANNIFQITALEVPAGQIVGQYGVAEQAVGWCPLTIEADGEHGTTTPDVIELYSLENTTFSTAIDCAPQTALLHPSADTSGYVTYGVFCSNVKLISYYDAAWSEVYAEITDHDGDASQYGYIPVLGGTGSADPNEGRLSPSPDAGGLFYYGDIDSLPNAPANEKTIQWTFRGTLTTPFAFSGHVVGRVTEDCDNSKDDDCDGVANNNCSEFDLFSPCYDHDDCTDNFCQDQGSLSEGLCHEAASEVERVVGSDTASADSFGAGVVDGDFAIVTAPDHNSSGGAIYVFERALNGQWSELAKEVPGDNVQGDKFGAALAVTDSWVAVGAPTRTGGGAVYLYQRSGNSISLSTTLVEAGTTDFGQYVDLYDGRLIVGSPSDDTAYIYTVTGVTWSAEGSPLSEGLLGDGFGSAVTVRDTLAIIGAPYADIFAGNAYVFHRSGSIWSLSDTLEADGHPTPGLAFGGSVSLSPNEEWAAIAASGENLGTVYLYSTDDFATPTAINPGGTVQFGLPVVLTNDWMVTGDMFYSTLVGRSHIYRRSGVTWTAHTTLDTPNAVPGFDLFGMSHIDLADSGTVLVGATGEDAAYFYPMGTAWRHEQILSPASIEANDFVGHSVAIDGDIMVVGAPGDNGSDLSGTAFVFRRNSVTGVWTEEATLKPTTDTGDRCGRSVDVSGDRIIIGCPFDDDGGGNSGSAFVYLDDGGWALEDQLVATDADGDDRFGTSVGIDGDWAIVGAIREDTAASNAGAAYTFLRTGSSWDEQTKLMPGALEGSDNFGEAVAISDTAAVIGAPADDDPSNSGTAYVYRRTGASWSLEQELEPTDHNQEDRFGAAVAIDGPYIAVGAKWLDEAGGDKEGGVYAFYFDNVWEQQAYLQASDAADEDRLGYSVGIAHQPTNSRTPARLVAGAGGDDDSGSYSGSVYTFTSNSSGTWAQETKIVASDGDTLDHFGGADQSGESTDLNGGVAISGDRIVVGAGGSDTEASDGGAVYVYQR